MIDTTERDYLNELLGGAQPAIPPNLYVYEHKSLGSPTPQVIKWDKATSQRVPLNKLHLQIEARSSHVPGLSPLSAANNTIALSYNKLGLSCAALKHYDAALKADPLNFDCYLGKGD